MTTLGEMHISRYDDLGEPRLKIRRADPWIEITDELVAQMRLPNPWASVDGDVLSIHDDFGASYVYRLTIHNKQRGTWQAEWPD